MDRILRLGAPALALALLVGCGAQESAPSTPATDSGTPPAAAPAPSTDAAPAPSAPAPAEAAPGLEGPKTSATSLTADEVANIKKLTADDAQAALKQAVCPVSDENLGAMDVPVKITAEGRTIYLCCKGCEDAVAKDPKKYIAKLDKK
ncbi:hypothetical protein [Paludisphaera rhizosphaerae]|uniref:hypothetical protein n=1 Tax=Paludisphaera rhizosphaerae TaxID=2711216 RepID=UPI0013EAA268|nr:hypothetical protein [Paludisphaera rhizosphaerae]